MKNEWGTRDAVIMCQINDVTDPVTVAWTDIVIVNDGFAIVKT